MLSKLDIFKPLPQELKGKYDVVHLRFFMAVAVDNNVQIVIKNLKDMLSKYDLILNHCWCDSMSRDYEAALRCQQQCWRLTRYRAG